MHILQYSTVFSQYWKPDKYVPYIKRVAFEKNAVSHSRKEINKRQPEHWLLKKLESIMRA